MEDTLHSRPGVVHSVHNPEPDYERPLLQVPDSFRRRFLERLGRLYGSDRAEEFYPELERVLQVYYAHKPEGMLVDESTFVPSERFSEQDVILITYGDLLRRLGEAPITTLAQFCDEYLEGTINTLHILPFFPYSSDRGFSIIDFEVVDPRLGSWQDIEDLEGRYRLMFDGVVNHVSSKSRWFQEFLDGNPYFQDFFISFESEEELDLQHRKAIFRPRTSSVLTRFRAISGERYVWTTFSSDQIDLNYHSPEVLKRVIEILLLYVRHGADLIRLDAVAFIWAEPGTSCVHLEQTHEIVKLFRDILNLVAPGVALVTETNVPHQDNLSYFGSGTDEAQMIYNFALPPLTLHAFHRENARILTSWADTLDRISDTATYFNFLDSHDGIGVLGAKDILDDDEIQFLVQRAQEHGGLVSYKTGADGTEEPYELNITWFSALNRADSGEDLAFQIKRFVASRVVALVLRGVPGIYLHSMLGTINDIEAVQLTHLKRDINRDVIDADAITQALQDPLSKVSRINREFGRLIKIRTHERAFHPNGDQIVLDLSEKVFAVFRSSPEGTQHILTLTNVSSSPCRVISPLSVLPVRSEMWRDLVSEVEFSFDEHLDVRLLPFDVVWLEAQMT